MSTLPQYAYVTSVSSNIAICTLIAPGAFNASSPNAPQPATVQNSANAFDLISYYISAGSTGVGSVLTFQELQLNSTANSPIWTPLVSPAAITLANSTNYNGVINGPLHGIRILISGVVGNGVAYARMTASVRTL